MKAANGEGLSASRALTFIPARTPVLTFMTTMASAMPTKTAIINLPSCAGGMPTDNGRMAGAKPMRRREAGGFGLCEVAKHWPCSRFYNLSFAVCLFTAESRCRVKGSGNFAEIAGAPFHKNEIRLCRFVPPDKSRPAVILTRGSALNYLFVDTIAPIAFSHRVRQLNHARE